MRQRYYGFLRQLHWHPRYNWNIFESDVKLHDPVTIESDVKLHDPVTIESDVKLHDPVTNEKIRNYIVNIYLLFSRILMCGNKTQNKIKSLSERYFEQRVTQINIRQ